MKKLLFIVIIFLTFSCSNKSNNEKAITIHIKKDQFNHNPMGNAVKVTLKNNSNNNSDIWLMSCNYTENFITNNENIIFSGLECDKNIPKRFSLKPLEEKIITLYVIYHLGLPKQNFKIGYLYINDINKRESTVEAYQKKKNNNESVKIIWSNPLII